MWAYPLIVRGTRQSTFEGVGMPLYEVGEEGLHRRPTADFAALEMYERAHLQRLLRDEVSALGEDLLVIAEEFGNWEDARRRIVLALDKEGRLVVIEIKTNRCRRPHGASGAPLCSHGLFHGISRGA
jgi:RecB family endonuclease NucS